MSPDISMCSNSDCRKRKECYRFKATPNPFRQAYMDFKPDDGGNCEGFMELKK